MYTSEARRNQNLAYLYLGNTLVATCAVAWGSGTETIRYQHTDALGSPVAETDIGGVVTKRNTYTPYGEAYGATNIDGTGYTGHVMDRATGLTYMQQRYYDPQIGRFLSVDPVTTDTKAGGNFNRYWYANNNPYRNIDSDGRKACGQDWDCAVEKGMMASSVNLGRIEGSSTQRVIERKLESLGVESSGHDSTRQVANAFVRAHSSEAKQREQEPQSGIVKIAPGNYGYTDPYWGGGRKLSSLLANLRR